MSDTKELIEDIGTVLNAWDAYQADMRPETRNDFLRAFDANVAAIRADLSEAKPVDVERLKRDNEKLREALKDLVTGCDAVMVSGHWVDNARQALATTERGEGE